MRKHATTQRFRIATIGSALAVVFFALSSCGDGGDDNSAVVIDESMSGPSDEMPTDNTETPWVNGFQLVREIGNPDDDRFRREQLYQISVDGRSIERFSVNDSGETAASPSVINRFDEMGFIVSRENTGPDGTATQNFDSRYDVAGRKTGEQSFNDGIPFLTSAYTYGADGRLVGKRVTSTANGSQFSDRVYTYALDGSLAAIRLSSPALADDLLTEYSFDATAGRLIEIREIDVTTSAVNSSESLSYDAAGNLVRIERFNADGASFSETLFEYEATSETIPNLPLHEIIHDIDLL